MGVGGAGGRLVELGERERRAQFEAARALLLRDGDGGQEGFLRRRRVGGVALQQDFAADAMQFRFECAIARCGRTSPALRRGSRWRGRNRPPGLRPRPARSSIARRKIRTFCSRSSSTPRRMSSSPPAGAPLSAVAQPSRNDAERAPHGQIVLAREAGEFGGVRRGAREVAAHQLEQGRDAVFPNARVPTWARSAIRVCMRSTSEIARSTSPSGHNEARDRPLRRRRRHVRSERPDRRRGRVGTRRARVPSDRAPRDTRRRTNT